MKIIIVFLGLVLSQLLFSQDNTDAVFYKKGTVVKFDCYAVSPALMDKLLIAQEENKVKDEVIVNMQKQINLKDSLSLEQTNEINLFKNNEAIYKASIAIQSELNKMYREDYNSLTTLRIQNKILGITTGVSVSIALAELAGIIVFGVLNYNGR
jgi:hypothetical protein